MLILTHNYDFYRTVSTRLGISFENRLLTSNTNSIIQLNRANYFREPFDRWKRTPNKKNIIALIPFVRNIVQYGNDKNLSVTGSDFNFLTQLLHEKNGTNNITFSQLIPLYNEYIMVSAFSPDVTITDIVMDQLYNVANSISDTDVELENKIILAMAIRHKAELFMIDQINRYTGTLRWLSGRNHRTICNGTSADFMSFVASSENQTRTLFDGCKQIITDNSKITILNEVNIMTPEHIHLNSFMYEPLLDMDITELLGLHQRVTAL